MRSLSPGVPENLCHRELLGIPEMQIVPQVQPPLNRTQSTTTTNNLSSGASAAPPRPASLRSEQLVGLIGCWYACDLRFLLFFFSRLYFLFLGQGRPALNDHSKMGIKTVVTHLQRLSLNYFS